MEKIHLSFKEQMRLVLPYTYHNIKEQVVVVVPVCAYLMLFQLIVLRYGLAEIGILMSGIVCVFIGLAFFLEGVRIGLVPIGEIVGNAMPKRYSSTIVLIFAFFLGLLASFGEPVLGTLQMAGAQLKPEHAPLLYALLVGKPMFLVGTVALGVGIAVVIGTLRFLHGWSLKPIILPLVLIAIVLTILAARNQLLASAIGLAWDTGAVIVGPVLCPLVLALGVGVCRATGKTSPSMAGFGMVGLISVVPIAAVVILTFGLYWADTNMSHKDGQATATSHAVATQEVTSGSSESSLQPALKKLPRELNFAAYYPKLRQMILPTDLDFKEYAQKIEVLPTNEKELFLRVYTINAHNEAIRIKQGVPPDDRKAAPAVLGKLGYDFQNTPLRIFEQAYTITVTDEKKLQGTIALKTGVSPDIQRKIPGILLSLGYTDKIPLLIESAILGARAILPIFMYLFIVLLILKCKGPPIGQIILSLLFAIIGLCLFFFGLSIGLGTLGNQVGGRLPLAFLDFLSLFPAEHSLYPSEIGKVVVVAFAVLLGYGATLAEPAFNVLGQQVEDVTQGAFKKNLFSQAVALGVGIGAGFGIISILYNINLLYLLLPPYILLAILTFFNKELFVNIAWDGGAVTTGPVTVPIKLAIGLSLSMATGAGEGFGVLALASAYPVLNILLLGLFLSKKKPKEA